MWRGATSLNHGQVAWGCPGHHGWAELEWPRHQCWSPATLNLFNCNGSWGHRVWIHAAKTSTQGCILQARVTTRYQILTLFSLSWIGFIPGTTSRTDNIWTLDSSWVSVAVVNQIYLIISLLTVMDLWWMDTLDMTNCTSQQFPISESRDPAYSIVSCWITGWYDVSITLRIPPFTIIIRDWSDTEADGVISI